MADIQIIKTDDIRKVPIKANQLIFCKDSSFYFDYDNHTRLHNAGIGTQIPDFTAGTLYDKNDVISVEGFLYRAKERFTSACCFDLSNWERLSTSATSEIKAHLIEYDNSESGLTSTSVQGAIDEIWDKVRNAELKLGTI